jgi:hypothetical protein
LAKNAETGEEFGNGENNELRKQKKLRAGLNTSKEQFTGKGLPCRLWGNFDL